MFMAFALIFSINGCKKDSTDEPNPTPPNEEYGIIMGSLTNGVTLQPISNGLVLLTNMSGTVLQQISSGSNGLFTISSIGDGMYQVKVQQNGYKEMVADSVVISSVNPKGNFVGLCPVETSFAIPVSALSGLILDNNTLPIANATVSISAEPESLTNGYFSSVLTNSSGQFLIPAIPLTTGNLKTLIPSFKIRILKEGYQPIYMTGIILSENRMKVRNATLQPASGGGTVIFEEAFETATAWTYHGFWHRQQNAVLPNTAYPQYVQLAPNDKSNGNIPDAFGGQYDAWFGEATTGNYMGTPASGQSNLSGGTGTEAHQGGLTSPPIQITSSSGFATLTFWSWYEVESVNPNSSGYDIMEVFVVDAADSTSQTSLGRLNPYSDPILENRDAIPYTSGGFNQAPVWKYEQFDLTSFVGQNIRLRFEFRTIDEMYNGFRGWFVDNIKITTDAPVKSGIPLPTYPKNANPR